MTGEERPTGNKPGGGVDRTQAVFALALVGITLVVFWPATGYGFINFDDPAYVTQNGAVLGGLSAAGLRFAFNVGHTGNWIPLTWLSHMLDVSLFGIHPGYHHLHSIVLHAANAGFLFLVLLRLLAHADPTPPRPAARLACAFVAAVFAVHPLRIESVVWISERKDLLAGLFWMLSLLAYLRFAERPGVTRMGVVTLLFALGLMAKPMLVSLPLVFCVLDVWPLRRLNTEVRGCVRLLLLEKAPLFALSLGSAALALLAQSRGGALSSVSVVTPAERLAGAVIAYAGYLGDLFWPVRLAVFYPFPQNGWPAWQVTLSAIVCLGISGLAVVERRRRPWLAAGWAWYVITAAPVIGLVKIGQQAGADRYTYLPLIGPVAALTWTAVVASSRFRGAQWVRGVVAIATVLALVAATRSQIGYWRDSETLFTRALEVTGDNHVAHYGLSLEFHERGDLERALHHGHEAVRVYPQFYDAYLHLAEMHSSKAEYADARFLLGLAVRQQPQNAAAYVTLGRVLMEEQRPVEAIAAFEDAVSRSPGLASAHYNLGVANEQVGRAERAHRDYATAARLAPGFFEALFGQGRLAAAGGRSDEALDALERAYALRPGNPEVLALLALVQLETGDSAAAEASYRALLALDPRRARRLRERLDAARPREPSESERSEADRGSR